MALAVFVGMAGTAQAQQQYGPPAPWHGCAEAPHADGSPCGCTVIRTFYRPGTPWNVSHHGGPGVRVTSPPVYVASGRIDIQGPPIYVEAPPVRVAPVQIYLHSPRVNVRPSDVVVEPPQVVFAPCEDSDPGPCRADGSH
ncbi:MAG: hypothetical protein ACXWVJ_09325 [Caulobacteraceae bacterium]